MPLACGLRRLAAGLLLPDGINNSSRRTGGGQRHPAFGRIRGACPSHLQLVNYGVLIAFTPPGQETHELTALLGFAGQC